MIALFCLLLTLLASPFKSKSRLEAENAALRRQLLILRRKVRGRVRLKNGDRLFFIQLYRWFPSILKSITIVRPETFMRWHRVGFRRYWQWKSRSRGGRPQIDTDLRALIRRISYPDHWLRPALCLRHHSSGPRNLVWINVTPHPTAEWIARPVTEAFPWVEAPPYLIRDQDRVYGATVTHQLRAMGIRNKPIVAERLIGSIRRECVTT